MDFPATDGPFSGSFKLNDAFLTGSGFEILNVFSLIFEFQGQRFTEFDSVFRGNGAASFLNGEFVGLDFGVQDDLISPTVDFSFISGFATSSTAATGEFVNHLDFATGSVLYRLREPVLPEPDPQPTPPGAGEPPTTSVPEPQSVLGWLAVAAIGLVANRNGRK